MPIVQQPPLAALFVPTLLCLVNGIVLCAAFALAAPLRRHPAVRVAALCYSAASIMLYTASLPPDGLLGALNTCLYLTAVLPYVPVIVYLLANGFVRLLDLALARNTRRRASVALGLRARPFAAVFRGSDRRQFERKEEQLARFATDPSLRQELIDLALSLGEVDRAAYHAYVLVELAPHGHAQGYALYRLAQILVEHHKRLDAAQPYLRRIIRLYPRSFFASYARRLVNQFEAYADREA